MQKSTVTITLAVIALVLGTTTITTTTVIQQVQASDDRTVQEGDDAIKAGWKEGKNDYLNGDAKEYDCPSENTDTYCRLYRTGYERGWDAQQDLGRDYGSDPR
jgi:hypothetical protein